MNITYQESSEGMKEWYVSAPKSEFGNTKKIDWKRIFANAGYRVELVSFEYMTNRNIDYLDDWQTISYKVITTTRKKKKNKGPEGKIEFEKLTKWPCFKIRGGKVVQISSNGNPVEEAKMDRNKIIALQKVIRRSK